jgi:NADH:ubiquinone oxidoreductase subunit 3 (subunit A)
MLFIIFAVGGIFLFPVMVVAGRKIACAFWRGVLGFPTAAVHRTGPPWICRII